MRCHHPWLQLAGICKRIGQSEQDVAIASAVILALLLASFKDNPIIVKATRSHPMFDHQLSKVRGCPLWQHLHHSIHEKAASARLRGSGRLCFPCSHAPSIGRRRFESCFKQTTYRHSLSRTSWRWRRPQSAQRNTPTRSRQ